MQNKLSDKELLEQEHDLQVDILNDLSGNLTMYEEHKLLLKEIKKRKLKLLPRLNGFT